ncbi:hypothetical protein ACFU53_44595 [Streptomyces sp. NPDC057474]|uniref:hypothetical protein n=1 Tax=Streptomyces sp. NPDC057474 TaxID=3346144 RepID=UPI0036CF5E0A
MDEVHRRGGPRSGLASAGSIKLYAGGAGTIGTATTVISADSDWRTAKLAFG